VADTGSKSSDVPRVILREPEDEVLRILREAQLLVLKYPAAVQEGFRVLVAEGRRFAQTPAGRRWKASLSGSELVRRGRVLWENTALGMLEDASDAVLPSSLLDAIVGALMSDNWTDILSGLTSGADGNEDVCPS
jgi:hypothetical protein